MEIHGTPLKKGEKKVGRKKGVPNKMTADLKDMIVRALENAGGETYLTKQATENPAAFMTLVGKIIPKDINADVKLSAKDLSIKVEFVKPNASAVS